MNENDLITEYIKEYYPEILETADFYYFKLGKLLSKSITDLLNPIKDILQQIIDGCSVPSINTEEKQEGK